MSSVKALKRQMRQARAQAAAQEAQAQALYQRGVGDNNYIAGEVGDFIGSQNSKIAAGYAGVGTQQAAASAALQQQMAQTTDKNASDAGGELSRLGLGQAGLGSMQSDSNFAQLMAAQQGTNDQSNTSLAGQNASAVGDLLLGMNRGQQQSNVGQLNNAQADTIQNIRNTFEQFRTEQRGRIADAKARAAAAKAYSRHYSSYGGGSYHSYGSGSGSSSQYTSGDPLAPLFNAPQQSANKPALYGATVAGIVGGAKPVKKKK